MKRVLWSLMVGFVCLPLVWGCRATSWAKQGDLPYQFQRRLNVWEAQIQKPIDEVYKATVAGLDDLELKPITKQVDKVSGLVDGTFADQMDYEIRLEVLAPKLTKLSIRCGILGDRERSMAVFRAIEKRF